MKIKKGDQVKILSGKDRGKEGKVLRIIPERFKALVEGVNIQKKHARPKREGEKGQVIQRPAAINISNLALICTKCGKATRVGFRVEENKKVRYCKKCQKAI